MAKNNSSNQDYTNNADGWDLSGGTTKRKLTVTGGDMTLTGSGANTYTFPASTDTLVGRASSDTLTNKTIDAAGTGNSISNVSSFSFTRQNDTTNITETTARTLTGWGVITITSGTAQYSETVTFNSSFTNLPIVVVCPGGDALTATGPSYGNGGNIIAASWSAKAISITTSSFAVQLNTSSVGANGYVFYQWIAMGH